jgi:hypothetical protein
MSATEPLTVYAARTKDTKTQLRAAGEDVKDQEGAIQFLAGLPPAYYMISAVLISGDKELTIDEMLPKLLQVEQMAQPERSSEAALAAKPTGGFGRGRCNGSGSKPQRRENRTCFYCGQQGHIKAGCPQLKRYQLRSSSNGQQYRRTAPPRQFNQHGAIALTANGAVSAPCGFMRWVLDTGPVRPCT